MSEPKCIWDARAELGEGVFWHPGERSVYWVDIIQSMLHRLASNGYKDSWHFPGRASAVMPCEGGGLLATFEDGLRHIAPDSCEVTPLLPLEAGQVNNRFNDGCTDTRGQFWFGSMDDRQQEKNGRFYRMDLQGRIHRLDDFGDICITNGPTFSTDGSWVYFTDTLEKKVFRARLNSQGEPGEPELCIDFFTLAGHPAGMCTDTDGGLWICHFGGARITRFTPHGEVERELHLPVPNITKCAFGGNKLQTLYITTAATGLSEEDRINYPRSGGLFAVEVPFSGVATIATVRPVPISDP